MGKLITRLKGVSSSDLSAATNAYKKKDQQRGSSGQ